MLGSATRTPTTGNAQAGGLSSRELLAMHHGLSVSHVVCAELTGSAASHVAYELLSVMSCRGSLNVR